MCTLCSKKCKSLSGLKRHMTCKHKDELEDKEGEQCKFTADLLAKMVDEVKQRTVNNKVFSKPIREELWLKAAYAFDKDFCQQSRVQRHSLFFVVEMSHLE